MLLDDPIAMYLDEGGKITPGFRLRNPQVIEDIPEPDIGVPNIPMVATADTGVASRNRYQYQEPVDIRDNEIQSVRDAMEQQHSDPIYGGNVESLMNDPIYGVGNMDAYLNDPIYGGQGYGSAFTSYDDSIPDLDIGQVRFGNTEYIGA